MNSGVCCVLLSNSETDQLVPSAGDLWNLQPESWNVQPENRAQNSLETFQLLMQLVLRQLSNFLVRNL
ncbi:hypothetical protein HUJ04_003478 [Dendroctonus ponderosae]|nr:hypothetical protein HUJ04_003478 [Dendroctonus ponderosae]